MNGRIGEGEYLPSIRGLAKDLKISVITTMKAYELLTQEGMIAPVQGKGYIVNPQDREMVREQQLRLLEQHRKCRRPAKLAGVPRRAGGNAESTIRYRLRRVAICLYIHKKGRK